MRAHRKACAEQGNLRGKLSVKRGVYRTWGKPDPLKKILPERPVFISNFIEQIFDKIIAVKST